MGERIGPRPGTASSRHLWTSAGSIDLATVLALPVEARWSGSAAAILTVGQGCTRGGTPTCTSAPDNTSPPVSVVTVISGVYYVTVSPSFPGGSHYGTWTPGTGTCTITGYTFQWQWSPRAR